VSGRRARNDRRAAPVPARRRGLPGAEATPLGLVSQYLTAGDLSRRPAPLEQVVAALLAVPAEIALGWVAAMLAPGAWGATWRAHQREQAREWFDASTGRRPQGPRPRPVGGAAPARAAGPARHGPARLHLRHPPAGPRRTRG
jgi:hypothetical protein